MYQKKWPAVRTDAQELNGNGNNNLPEGCSVRCHCMVQDVRGVEYFAKINTQT
ncbi:hypothetical protein T11_2575 [Trichinella zimbabwensis]|uniref:Uncharacterized protein n=1 Tax=Trichinella zimbabwensis TaxID=268475 RepID=A0A0V1GFS5_9BILA|nr:hypothetical protein T11_2575 [Trichinella zimbabwensis]